MQDRIAIIKPRYETEKLKIYRSLNGRMNLSDKEKHYYWNLEKGFQGELMFDEWLKKMTNEFLVLNDVTFEFNNSEFQIDSLLISQDKIYIFDIKNFEGDYYYNANRLYKKSGVEIQDPLLQLKRCESLFHRLLKDIGFRYPINYYLVFINPEFYLYQASVDDPILFSTQLKRFFNNLNATPSKLNKNHYKLTEKLMKIRLTKSSYDKVPEYHYDQLRKGLMCVSCHSLNVHCNGNSLICNSCGSIEKVSSAILRNIDEIQLLFPDRKITTNGIYDWCGGMKSKKTIRTILSKNFNMMGHGRTIHYVNKINNN